jgi:hypothetical protein
MCDSCDMYTPSDENLSRTGWLSEALVLRHDLNSML